jgi:hypothetical protein
VVYLTEVELETARRFSDATSMGSGMAQIVLSPCDLGSVLDVLSFGPTVYYLPPLNLDYQLFISYSFCQCAECFYGPTPIPFFVGHSGSGVVRSILLFENKLLFCSSVRS